MPRSSRPSAMLAGFTSMTGCHCITTAMRQIFAFHGHPVSEEFLLGMGEGLSFAYLNSADGPMLCGRAKPGVFEETLSRNLGVKMKVHASKSPECAFQAVKKILDRGEPVMIYADMALLPYLHMPNFHFGAHAVVLCGLDEAAGCVLVSDRDADLHEVKLSDLAAAQSSTFRPFPANNKYVEFDFSDFRMPDAETVWQAVLAVCRFMLEPPTRMLGISGIRKFSTEVKKWGKMPRPAMCNAAGMNYAMIDAIGGTGGGIFRKMYGNFLLETAPLMDADRKAEFTAAGQSLLSTAAHWDAAARMLLHLANSGDTAGLSAISAAASALADEEEAIAGKLCRV